MSSLLTPPSARSHAFGPRQTWRWHLAPATLIPMLLLCALWARTCSTAEYISHGGRGHVTDWSAEAGSLGYDSYDCDTTPGWASTLIGIFPSPPISRCLFGHFGWQRYAGSGLRISVPSWTIALAILGIYFLCRSRYGSAGWGWILALLAFAFSPLTVGLFLTPGFPYHPIYSRWGDEAFRCLICYPVVAASLLAFKDVVVGSSKIIINGIEGPPPWSPGPRRRYFRIKAGLCPSCGYDIRESADRCPECGLPKPKSRAHISNR